MKAQQNLKRLPDTQKTKGPLEKYAVSQMKLVGIIQQGGKNWALIKNGDGRNVYSVKTGDFIGKDYGLIDKITKHEVFITEIHKTPSDLWEERKVHLELKNEEQ